MRRIADLTPGSAKTDAKDAAVIAGAARTMPHTLRAVSASDEDAAALSMLTGFDLDLARAVNQTANRIRGQWLTPDPAPPSRPWWGRGRAHDAAAGAHRRLAHPSRPEARGQDKDWRQAQSPRVQAARHLGRPDRLGPGAPDRGGRRHQRRSNGAAPPGTSAHRPTRPADRCRHPGRRPWRVAHPHVPGPDHTCPGSGVPAAAVLAGPDPGQGPPVTGAHLASYAGLAPVTRRSGSSIRGEHVSHGGNKRLKHAIAPLRRRLTALRPRLPGLLPAQTRSRQTALGQAVPAQAHHRILTLHAMTRNHTLHTPTSHETTHRHLTHHIGAPVDWLVGFGGASFINRRCAIVLTRVTSVSGRLGWAKVLDDVDSGARNPLRFCKSCGSFLCQISIVRVV